MINKKENRSFSNFGFSTILLSFVMICVVTFSALTLATANSDYQLSSKVATKTSEYYKAQERAYERLRVLEPLFIDCYMASNDSKTYFSRIADHSTNHGTFITSDGACYLLFEEPIAENCIEKQRK